MSMPEFKQTWSSLATSGGQSAIHSAEAIESVWYFQASSGVSTATVRVQSALSSGGPWFDDASNTALTSGTLGVLRVTGPFAWVRPWANSTGITIRAVGVS